MLQIIIIKSIYYAPRIQIVNVLDFSVLYIYV